MSDGIITVVGIGPGDREHMTQEAVEAVKKADIVAGYTVYTEILRQYFPDKQYLSTPMKKEADRCRMAYEQAVNGLSVALVSSGDSGIYGMAGLMYEIAAELNSRCKKNVEIRVAAGVTAASAAAAALGAPLMHDTAFISLSDLMTPLDLIMKRVKCAAEGDFVICLYNPRSKKRADYIYRARDIILKYRGADTPVGIVKNVCREGQSVTLTTLSKLERCEIDMFCTVIIGNSQTYVKNGKMITPRGYKYEIRD